MRACVLISLCNTLNVSFVRADLDACFFSPVAFFFVCTSLSMRALLHACMLVLVLLTACVSVQLFTLLMYLFIFGSFALLFPIRLLLASSPLQKMLAHNPSVAIALFVQV